jgi:[acyl-carrier-protein] S-malonyltransferase
MQNAVPPGLGKMAAIVGLDNEAIEKACQEAAQGAVVSAANFNSAGQTVIAGEAEAVERAMVLCKETGAKRALPLKVSVPSHCALMQPAADELAEDLEGIEFSEAKIPVVQNATAQLVSDPTLIKQNLLSQLYLPVRWVDCIQIMSGTGISRLVECGPGKVLSGLVKRINPELVCIGTESPEDLSIALAKS